MANAHVTATNLYGARWILDDVDLLPDVPGECCEDRWFTAARRVRRREVTYKDLACELSVSINCVAGKMRRFSAALGKASRRRPASPEPLDPEPSATPQERALYMRRMIRDGVPEPVVRRLMASVV